MQKTILTYVLLLLMGQLYAQEMLLVHAPFSEKDVPTWRYSQDTAVFTSQTTIWGLFYQPLNKSCILKVKNAQGREETAEFIPRPLDLSQLNWHPYIKKTYRSFLESKDWYYIEITPSPSVLTAEDGVHFLEVIQDGVNRKQAMSLTYQMEGQQDWNTCILDFRKGQGYFEPLWEKLLHYQKLLAEKQNLEQEITTLKTQCEPHGFQKIEQWAGQLDGLTTDLKKSDINLFQAVENLKIVTEAIPDDIASPLKLKLHELLLLDIKILKVPQGASVASKRQRKADLLQQLSLYPELKDVLTQYQSLTGVAVNVKKTEQEQAKEVQRIGKLYKPYKNIYETYWELSLLLGNLDAQLETFN